jgi:predicted RNase H-like HicB family nuclease
MTMKKERSDPMTRSYVALIRKEAGTDYWVDVPDIPGCASSGKTEDEAKANFAEALKLHCETLMAEGAEMPTPRSRGEVLAAEENPYLTDYLIEV